MPPSGATPGGAATPIVPMGAHDSLIAPAFFVAPEAPGPGSPLYEDLAAVRVLIESVCGHSEVNWAAGIVIASGRKQIVITTDRGRGWMPAGTVLPAAVELPWDHPEAAWWEGLTDPGRVIVEYAHAVGGKLTALAATQFSAPRGAESAPFAPVVDEYTHPHPELLATVPLLHGETATRTKLQVDPDLFAQAQAINGDENAQRGSALGCANKVVHRANVITDGAVGEICHRILTHVHNAAGHNPRRIEHQLRPLWEQLEGEHATLRDQERAARVDVRDVAVGKLDTAGADVYRPLLARTYAAETVIGLRNPHALGALENAVYFMDMLKKYLPQTHREAV